MENLKSNNMQVSFENDILKIKFNAGSNIELADIKSVYTFGSEKKRNKRFCILFDSSTNFDVSEEVMEFISDPENNKEILAKAYVVNTKESKIKAKLHLTFDHPSNKPMIFETESEALAWLTDTVNKQ